MKRKVFYTVSLFLLLAVLISAFPLITAYADKSGKCGTNVKWELNEYGQLKITGTGKMYDYSPSNPAPWSKDNVFSLNFGYGITHIGDYAFYDLFVGAVDIGASIRSIGECAFMNCYSLYRVNIQGDLESIGYEAFRNCKDLETVNIPDSVKSIGKNAFFNTKLYNDSSNWVSEVLYIDNHLIAADMQNDRVYPIKRGTITIADFAFEGCLGLHRVYFPYSVKNIGKCAFVDCLAYSDGIVPESVENIGDCAFAYQDYGTDEAHYDNFRMYCYKNSAAHKFASAHGLEIILVDDNVAVNTFYGLYTKGKYTYGISHGIDYYNFTALIDGTTEIKTLDYKEWDVYVDFGEIIKTGNLIIQDDIHISVAIVSGELNGDGKIDSTDYILVKSHILKTRILTDEMYAAADTNVDGKIDTTDYINIKRKILHID